MWHDGFIGDCSWEAKVYSKPSVFGIDNGNVSRLRVKDEDGIVVINYDRGWDVEPETNKLRQLLKDLLDHLR